MVWFKPNNKEDLIKAVAEETHTKIWYADDEIDANTAKLLGEGLRQNTSLTHLWLSDNAFTGATFSDMCSTLGENKTLRKLQVAHNNVGDAGVESLAQALQSNYTLTDVELTECEISDDGVGVFARLLMENNTLTSLNLFGNKTTIKGIKLLKLGLNENSSLTKLNYGTFDAPRATVESMNLDGDIHRLLERNKHKKQENEKVAYEKVLNSIDTVGPWNRCKLMIIGEGRAGKTSTVRSLTGQSFTNLWDSTIGIDLVQSKTSNWNLRPSDVAQERYIQEFTADRAVDLLAVEAKSKGMTFAKAWSMGYAMGSMKVPGGIDKNPFEVSKSAIKGVESTQLLTNVKKRESNKRRSIKAPTHNRGRTAMVASRVEGAMKDTGVSLTIWDYGGQEVFHALHHLFLTQYGIYVLVFDVRTLLKDDATTISNLMFWLNSVKMHAEAAHVIPVATFKDAVTPDELESVSAKFQTLINPFTNVLTPSGGYSFYAVENTTKEGIKPLQDLIRNKAENLDYVKQQVSINWIRSLDRMGWEARLTGWIPFEKAFAIAKSCLITSPIEFERLLQFFHELGVLVHFGKSQALHDVVTLHPQWLVREISKVIRDSQLHEFDKEEIRKRRLHHDVIKMFSEGLASMDMLEFLWKEKEVEFLMALMRSLALASDWKFGRKEKKFFVPSLVQVNRKIARQGAKCVLDFSSFYLPDGVFERIVCICIDHSSSVTGLNQPIIAKGAFKVWFQKNSAVTLHKEKERIVVYVEKNKDAMFTLKFLKAQLKKIKMESMANLQWKVLVEVEKKLVLFADAPQGDSNIWKLQQEVRDVPSTTLVENFNKFF